MEPSANTDDQAIYKEFRRYAQRRNAYILGGGLVAIVIGVGLLPVLRISIISACLILAGLGYLASGLYSRSLIAKSAAAMNSSSRPLLISTYTYRTPRALKANRLSGEFWTAGSGRTPLAEFAAPWYTPGVKYSNQRASVYGELAMKNLVVAIVGSSVLVCKITKLHE